MKINWLWILPIILFFFQFIYTVNSSGQIRYEELAESVRNVYWLEKHTVYDGVSSNVGWYGSLLIIYKTIGFSLHAAKFFRLFLALISLFCLAAVMKKYLGERLTWLPLLAIGLSPTLLFFNTLQTSYGLDLQYFPIGLYLILSLNFSHLWSTLIRLFLLGSICMIAWMSYPTFIYYLPVLGLIFLHKLWLSKQNAKKYIQILGTAVVIISFFLPLILAYFYVKDPNLLIYDPKTQGGIFRGAGIFYLDLNNFLFNFNRTLGDIFGVADSYYFEVSTTDFSLIFPTLALLLTFIASIVLFVKEKKYRLIIGLAYFLLLSSLILSNLTFDPSGRPGIRRSTAVLTAVYSLFTLAWYHFHSLKEISNSTKKIIVVILLLLPVHHIVSYPINLLSLNTPSRYQYSHIFGLAQTPEKALNLYMEDSLKDNVKLGCQDQNGNLVFCRYAEGFAAIAGSCLWNSLSCHQVEGYDPQTKQFIPLKTDLWETYYWEH